MSSFKSRLYDNYVTSGQASISASKTSKNLFPERKHFIDDIIDKHLNAIEKSAKIVDIACGNGPFVYFLQNKGYSNVHGFDVSKEQIELGQQYGICNLKQLDLNTYLKSDEKNVQVFVLMDILEHFEREELLSVLDSLYDKLKQGGFLVIHVPNAEGIFGMRVRYGDLTHELSFTQKSMNQVLSTVGFKQVHCFEDKPVIHGVVSFMRSTLWWFSTLFFRGMLAAESGVFESILSQNMLVIAKK